MMKRLFTAIKFIPDEDFVQVYDSLRQKMKHDKIKWVEPHNLHLTLKFFGEMHISEIDKINLVTDKVIDSFTPFTIRPSTIGVFGSRYKPRVVWFGFENPKQLSSIGNSLLSALNEAGFPSDRQNFVPHLTVGRIKEIRSKVTFQNTLDEYKNLKLNDFRISDLYLFESILTPKGPIYNPIKKYALNF